MQEKSEKQNYLYAYFTTGNSMKMKKLCKLYTTFSYNPRPCCDAAHKWYLTLYFFKYITSFTSLTVRGTSGSAAATNGAE